MPQTPNTQHPTPKTGGTLEVVGPNGQTFDIEYQGTPPDEATIGKLLQQLAKEHPNTLPGFKSAAPAAPGWDDLTPEERARISWPTKTDANGVVSPDPDAAPTIADEEPAIWNYHKKSDEWATSVKGLTPAQKAAAMKRIQAFVSGWKPAANQVKPAPQEPAQNEPFHAAPAAAAETLPVAQLGHLTPTDEPIRDYTVPDRTNPETGQVQHNYRYANQAEGTGTYWSAKDIPPPSGFASAIKSAGNALGQVNESVDNGARAVLGEENARDLINLRDIGSHGVGRGVDQYGKAMDVISPVTNSTRNFFQGMTAPGIERNQQREANPDDGWWRQQINLASDLLSDVPGNFNAGVAAVGDNNGDTRISDLLPGFGQDTAGGWIYNAATAAGSDPLNFLPGAHLREPLSMPRLPSFGGAAGFGSRFGRRVPSAGVPAPAVPLALEGPGELLALPAPPVSSAPLALEGPGDMLALPSPIVKRRALPMPGGVNDVISPDAFPMGGPAGSVVPLSKPVPPRPTRPLPDAGPMPARTSYPARTPYLDYRGAAPGRVRGTDPFSPSSLTPEEWEMHEQFLSSATETRGKLGAAADAFEATNAKTVGPLPGKGTGDVQQFPPAPPREPTPKPRGKFSINDVSPAGGGSASFDTLPAGRAPMPKRAVPLSVVDMPEFDPVESVNRGIRERTAWTPQKAVPQPGVNDAPVSGVTPGAPLRTAEPGAAPGGTGRKVPPAASPVVKASGSAKPAGESFQAAAVPSHLRSPKTKVKDAARAVGRAAVDTWDNLDGVARGLTLGGDMGHLGRQGSFLAVRRPGATAAMIENSFKAVSSKGAKEISESIAAHPLRDEWETFGLNLTDSSPTAPITSKEEVFRGRLARTMPWVKQFVQKSDDVFTGGLNTLRASAWEQQSAAWKAADITPESHPNEYKALAQLINSATGRGDLGKLEKFQPLLTRVFGSPKLTKAQLDLINPMFYAKMYKTAPKAATIAMKDLAANVGARATLIGLLSAGGVSISLDPASAVFLKAKVGKSTYIDVSGGLASWMRLIYRTSSGRYVSASGKETKLDPAGRVGVAGKFLESKLGPVASLPLDAVRGKTFEGKEFTWGDALTRRITPLVAQQFLEAYGVEGPGVALTLLPVDGSGNATATYANDRDKREKQ